MIFLKLAKKLKAKDMLKNITYADISKIQERDEKLTQLIFWTIILEKHLTETASCELLNIDPIFPIKKLRLEIWRMMH